MKEVKGNNQDVNVVVTKGDGGLVYGTTPLESFYDYSKPTVTVKSSQFKFPDDNLVGHGVKVDTQEDYFRSIVHIIPSQINKYKAECVICDIDGCLNFYTESLDGYLPRSMLMHRDPNESPVQWSDFEGISQVSHNETLIDILNKFCEDGLDIIFVTARSETQRISTEEWLDSLPLDGGYRLFMRPIGMNTGDPAEIKKLVLCTSVFPERIVKVFIEDTQSIIDMYKGLPKHLNSFKHTTIIKVT